MKFIKLHANALNMTGKKFGRLTGIGPIEIVRHGPKTTSVIWLFKCDCGNDRVAAAKLVASGNIKSCGCFKAETALANLPLPIHMQSASPEYDVWHTMKQRCGNPNATGYDRYGAKGIKVCDRWLNSFENFFADMGPRPAKGYTIDRWPNNDGNYEPENVRWATRKENQRNRKCTLIVTAFGRTGPLSSFVDDKAHYGRAFSRISVCGWPAEKAITAPLFTRG